MSLKPKGTQLAGSGNYTVTVADTTIGDPGVAFNLELGNKDQAGSILFKGAITVTASITYTSPSTQKSYNYEGSTTINHNSDSESRGILLTKIPIVIAFGDPYYRAGDQFSVKFQVEFNPPGEHNIISYSGSVEVPKAQLGTFQYTVEPKSELGPGEILAIDDCIRVIKDDNTYYEAYMQSDGNLCVYEKRSSDHQLIGEPWGLNRKLDSFPVNCALYMNPLGYFEFIKPDGTAELNSNTPVYSGSPHWQNAWSNPPLIAGGSITITSDGKLGLKDPNTGAITPYP